MFAPTRSRLSSIGKANLDWPNLGFGLQKTNGHMEYTWNEKTGWDNGKFQKSPYMSIHTCSTVLHYGPSLFEGLKGYAHADGKFRMFREDENCKRMARGAYRMVLPEVPQEIFKSAIDQCVQKNVEYIPPHETGGSLYVRPLLFGNTPQMGVHPAADAKFLVICTPVASYYKEGVQGVNSQVVTDFDRAAPLGMGAVKAAGNYAADLLPGKLGKEAGFPIGLYLDPIEHKYVEEFNTSNFVGIKNNTFITPDSGSVLGSVTNMSLMQVARDLGMRVERRKINFREEIGTFEEVGAIGTAVVVTPLSSMSYDDKIVHFPGAESKTLLKIRSTMSDIQFGRVADKHNWLREIEFPSSQEQKKKAALEDDEDEYMPRLAF